MKRVLLFITIAAFVAVICVSSCKHTAHVIPADGNFPDSIASILITKCTNAGCHNQASYLNAGELRLDSWDNLFLGGVSGAVVVAYSTRYSPLLYYVCPDAALGTQVSDPGHLPAPLSTAEYHTLANWIAKGAPDKNGNIPFATNPDTRQKIYLSISGCNYVAVIDAKSRQVMREIPVGSQLSGNIHDVEVSGDGKYAYVSFYNGTWMQKIDTRSDTVAGYVDLSAVATAGQAGWSILSLSPQDTAISVSGYYNNSIVTVNTANMTINQSMSVDALNTGSSPLQFPHGIATNAFFDTFLVTLQLGNTVEKIHFKHPGLWFKQISLNGAAAGTDSTGTSPNPHQIEMAPDYSKYFVTCQNSNEVRVMDAYRDTLIKVIPVGTKPQEMAVSKSKHYLFVVCMEDAANTRPGARGSVYVIDYNTMQIITILYGDFYQPHDVAIDELDGLVYICSTNSNPSGPAPHHVPACAGRAGWFTVYDLNTLQMENKRYEVDVFPYAISARF